uniref:DUF5641 domain-containing protein n=1 Tax=Strigamia maritima TaxID=126957 RepID=T1IZP8_STRMM
MVRSVKEKLKRVVSAETWEYEEFDTLCKKISAVLNSRPLSYVSEPEVNQFALTPEHFLTGGMPKYLLRKPIEKLKNKDLIRIEKQRRRNLIEFWKHWKKSYLMQLRNFHETRVSSNCGINNSANENSGPTESSIHLTVARVCLSVPSLFSCFRSLRVFLLPEPLLARLDLNHLFRPVLSCSLLRTVYFLIFFCPFRISKKATNISASILVTGGLTNSLDTDSPPPQPLSGFPGIKDKANH